MQVVLYNYIHMYMYVVYTEMSHDENWQRKNGRDKITVLPLIHKTFK